MASLRRRRPSLRPAILRAGVLGCLALLTWGLVACGGGDDQAEPAYRLHSLTLRDLHSCKAGQGGPAPASLRCGAIDVPFERQAPSLGKTRIGFAVLPRKRRDRPSRG